MIWVAAYSFSQLRHNWSPFESSSFGRGFSPHFSSTHPTRKSDFQRFYISSDEWGKLSLLFSNKNKPPRNYSKQKYSKKQWSDLVHQRKLEAKKRILALMIVFHLEGFFELSKGLLDTEDSIKADHILSHSSSSHLLPIIWNWEVPNKSAVIKEISSLAGDSVAEPMSFFKWNLAWFAS